jgi:1-acyl-sn-glycerol-3-phosphate acyltransferase
MEKDDVIQKIIPILQTIRAYHRHSVVGMDNVPRDGRTLVVVNHSLATYDILLLMTAIYSDIGRLPRPLIDRLFFKVPYAGELAQFLGSKQGSQENAEELLNQDEIITVAPGGMLEALRPSTERYQLRWDRRIGFCKLAMRTRAPIVLAACPKADDLYDVYPNPVTDWFYKNHKIPVFIARGLGLSPIPRPIKLTHFVSEPMVPPKLPKDPEEVTQVATEFHKKVVARMEGLIADGIKYRK